MKLATTTEDFEAFSDDPISKIKLIQKAGFKNIDLSLYNVSKNKDLLLADDWQKYADRLKTYAEENGISFVQAHAPSTNPLDREKFEESVRVTARSIEVCGYLGIKNVVFHTGWDKEATKEEWFINNKKFVDRLLPVAEKNDLCLLHENSTSVNIPWYYSKTGKQMREFSDYIDHPLFHSCWDTGHANIEGNQYREILDIGDDLRAIHFNDNRGKRDEHIIPFFGTMNVDEVMQALIDIGYKGYFTFEATSTLRPSKYWLGNRREFDGEAKLEYPPLFLKEDLEKMLCSIGKYILSSYGVFEE